MISIPSWSDFNTPAGTTYPSFIKFQSHLGLISTFLNTCGLISFFFSYFNPILVWFQLDAFADEVGLSWGHFNPILVWFQLLPTPSPWAVKSISIPSWSDFNRVCKGWAVNISNISIPSWSDFNSIRNFKVVGNVPEFQSHLGLISTHNLQLL